MPKVPRLSGRGLLEALGKVVDPELGLDIVSLRLIYQITVELGQADVDLTMTSPGCPWQAQLLFQAQNEILKVPGVEKAQMNLVWSPPWSPEMMSLEAKMSLGFA